MVVLQYRNIQIENIEIFVLVHIWLFLVLQIVRFSSNAIRKFKPKRVKLPEHPQTEHCAFQCSTQCRSENILIPKDKAKTFATKLGIKGFGASNWWLTNLKKKKKNNIGFRKMCGEAVSVGEQEQWSKCC